MECSDGWLVVRALNEGGTVAGQAEGGQQARADGLALLAELVREARCYPRATVLAEFATFGPVLNALVGGRRGVPRYRQGVERDEERFIPLYRQTFEALLADVPGGRALMAAVDGAIEHDHRENANLLAAFELLDPDGSREPRVLGATRYAAPAAGHAAVKFALLAPAVVPAAAGAALHWARRSRIRWAVGLAPGG